MKIQTTQMASGFVPNGRGSVKNLHAIRSLIARAPEKTPGAALQALKKNLGRLISEIDASKPFASLGDMLVAAARAEAGVADDPRLIRAPAGASEGDPPGGGFSVPTVYAQDLVGMAYDEAVLAPLCDHRETARPLADVRIPAIDEKSRADGSRWGGFTSYWATEAAQVNSSFPRFRELDFSAKKIIAVCIATNELVMDAPMLGAHLKKGFAAEAGFKIDQAALAGTGVGTPQGILTCPALITVAKETGQASGTIVKENIRNMWSRLPAPSRKRAVWLVNEDVEAKLDEMADGGGAAAALYMPAGTGGNPYALLKGRPVLVMEQSPQVGAVGDIVLADPSHYILVDGGMIPSLSVHFKFDSDETTFRFVWRVDGKGAFASPITPFNGSSTRSPFVALAAR